jgi:hypothetical protein
METESSEQDFGDDSELGLNMKMEDDDDDDDDEDEGIDGSQYTIGYYPHVSNILDKSTSDDEKGDGDSDPPGASNLEGLEIQDGRIYGSIFEKVKGSPHLKRCKLCGKLVRGRKHRFVHMPGTYSCPYCPCVYTRSDNLNAHVRVKHGKPKCAAAIVTPNASNLANPVSNSAASTLVSLISAASLEKLEMK